MRNIEAKIFGAEFFGGAWRVHFKIMKYYNALAAGVEFVLPVVIELPNFSDHMLHIGIDPMHPWTINQ
ncbi:hypothetical protein JJB09_23665 [Rhizobium sp. KVB221]|uniref:Uncharacterized protein n=1 Tax=Rhizobium setariae TaxID=2801340 RepID=A0A936YU46_9HYPH|nr:hypothetical protein [Rhizobium setariae]MBL0375017.1 hypothetical protein [Rhizobium setariae]